MALCDSHCGSHWLSLPLSGILWPSLAHYCSLISLIQSLIGSEGPCLAVTLTHFVLAGEDGVLFGVLAKLPNLQHILATLYNKTDESSLAPASWASSLDGGAGPQGWEHDRPCDVPNDRPHLHSGVWGNLTTRSRQKGRPNS